MAAKMLIASGSRELQNSLSFMGREAGFDDITVTGGNNLRQIYSACGCDLTVMALPLENEFGLETAAHIGVFGGLLMIVPPKVYEEVCAKGARIAAPILPRSASEPQVVNMMRFLLSVKRNADIQKEENDRLKAIVDEMKLVNRAKCVLIEYLRISEREAHRQLQKKAMDQRLTLTDAALDVLKIYEYQKPSGNNKNI
ncbi:MAG: ANTAR domain-containing protein [Ruminococcus sp.]|nr:ANTAR domain-containing protein [Ruminococcus sp.]